MEKSLITLFTILFLTQSQTPSCQNGNYPTDIFSGQVRLTAPTVFVQNPQFPIIGQDLYNYTYKLPLPFRKVPSVAISVSHFEANYTQNWLFYVRTVNDFSRENITFLIKIDQLVGNWSIFCFNFIAETREDIITFNTRLATKVLCSSQQVKNESFLVPYADTWTDFTGSKIAVFTNGFQYYSKPTTYPNNPFQITTTTPQITPNGISLTITLNTTSQLESLYLSLIVVSSKLPLQTISIFNHPYTAGQNKFVISPSGVKQATENNQRVEMNRWKGVVGLGGFSGENSGAGGKSYGIEVRWYDAQVMVNVTTNRYNYLNHNFFFVRVQPCSECSGATLYDRTKNICLAFCPPNTYIEYSECKYCPQGQYATPTGCTTCSTNQEWNGTACKCKPDFYRNTSGSCVSCPVGTSLVNDKCQCSVPGQVYDTVAGICVCPLQMFVINGKCQGCEIGKVWDGSNCVDVCLKYANMTFDGKSCVCRKGFVYQSPTSCTCTGYVDLTGACQVCPANSSPSGQSCTCNTGYTKNTRNECIPTFPTLPPTFPTTPYPSPYPYSPYQFPYPPSINTNLITLREAIPTATNTLTISVRLNTIPQSLLVNGQCPLCANLLTVQTNLPNTFKTVTQYSGVSAVDGRHQLAVSLVFEAFPLENFFVSVRVSAGFVGAFGGMDVLQAASKYIDLRTLSRAEENKAQGTKNIRKDILN